MLLTRCHTFRAGAFWGLAVLAAVSACATPEAPALIEDEALADTCERFASPADDDETVVVMRDQSARSRGAAILPSGGVIDGGAVVVGSAIVTPDVAAGGYKSSQTRVEMRPCPTTDSQYIAER